MEKRKLTPEEARARQSEGGKYAGSLKIKTKGFGSDKKRASEAGRKGAEKRWKNSKSTHREH